MQSNDIIAVLSSNEGIRFIQNNLNKDPCAIREVMEETEEEALKNITYGA